MDLITAAGERDRLRQDFPSWCIFHDPYATRWFAVHGRNEQRVAPNPHELRRRLLGYGADARSPQAEPESEQATGEVRALLDQMTRRR